MNVARVNNINQHEKEFNMFVKNTIKITGADGAEVAQKTRDKIAFLKMAGIQVTSIEAHGVFSFQGKLPLTFDEDDAQTVHLPVGRKLMNIGNDQGLGCVPTADTVVEIVTLVEGEEFKGDEDECVNVLDVLDDSGRKLAKTESEDEKEEEAA